MREVPESPGVSASPGGTNSTAAPSRLWGIVLIVFAVISLLSLGYHLLEAANRYGPGGMSHPERGWDGLIEQIERDVPSDAALLIDAAQRPTAPADQFFERELAYWVYPRRVYSAAAVRAEGRGLGAFVEQRGIRWGLRFRAAGRFPAGEPIRGPELFEIDPATIDDLFAGSRSIEKAARVSGKWQPEVARRPSIAGLLGTLLALAGVLAAGWGTLQLIDVARIGGRLETAAVSWLVGLSVVSLAGLIGFLAGARVGPATTLLPGLLLCAAGAMRRWKFGRRAGVPHTAPVLEKSFVERLAGWIACGIVLASVLIGVLSNLDGFDFRMQWGYKARLMLDEPGPFGESVFQDADHVHFHPRYPLLVPVAEAMTSVVTGEFRESCALFLFPLTFAAGAVVLAGGLRREGVTHAVVGGLLLLVVPAWCGFLYPIDNLAMFNGCPELVLGVALLAGIVFARQAWRTGHAGWFALAALMLVTAGLAKAEGLVHVLVIVTTGLLLAGRSSGGPRRSAVISGVVVVAVLVVHELVFTRQVTAGILPDDYRVLLTPANLLAGLNRLPWVAGRFVFEGFISPRFGALGLLIVIAACRSRGRWRHAATAWPLTVCGLMLAAYCVPFLVIPVDWQDNLDWAHARLVAELSPLGVWCLATLLLPREP